MPKVFIKRDCTLPIILDDGKVANANVPRGTFVNIQKVDWTDVKDGYYSPIKQEIVGTDGKTIQRSRPPVEKAEVPKNELTNDIQVIAKTLTDAVQAANDVIQKLKVQMSKVSEKEIPESKVETPINIEPKAIPESQAVPDEVKDSKLIVSPGHEEEYITEDEANLHNVYTDADLRSHMSNVKKIIMNNVAEDSDHFASIPGGAEHLPVFAEARVGQRKVEGEIQIISEAKVIGQDILDKTPVSLINDGDGKLDVIKTLGMTIVNPEALTR